MTAYHGIPIELSNDVPDCSECGEHMVVAGTAANDGQAQGQLAKCLACGHTQRFPWPLAVVDERSHWWVTNL